MKEVKITKGMVAIVDDEDFERISRFKWHARVSPKTCYAGRSVHNRRTGERSIVYMHREIMNAPAEMQVDHINSCGLDNRKSNLRLATHTQNIHNTRPRPGKSHFKGVYRQTNTRKWVAQITVGGKVRNLGSFESEVLAAEVYNEAARKHYGEFAWLNEIPTKQRG